MAPDTLHRYEDHTVVRTGKQDTAEIQHVGDIGFRLITLYFA